MPVSTRTSIVKQFYDGLRLMAPALDVTEASRSEGLIRLAKGPISSVELSVYHNEGTDFQASYFVPDERLDWHQYRLRAGLVRKRSFPLFGRVTRYEWRDWT